METNITGYFSKGMAIGNGLIEQHVLNPEDKAVGFGSLKK